MSTIEERFQELAEKMKDAPPPMVKSHRVGKFRVDCMWLRGDWHSAIHLFQGMVVVKTQADFLNNTVEYTALCDAFDEIPETVEAPEYRAVLERQNDGSVKLLKWERI